VNFRGLLRWILGPEKIRPPKNLADLESLIRVLLRIGFWVATLAPLILIPLYFFAISVPH
jgi:hypothetical protein